MIFLGETVLPSDVIDDFLVARLLGPVQPLCWTCRSSDHENRLHGVHQRSSIRILRRRKIVLRYLFFQSGQTVILSRHPTPVLLPGKFHGQRSLQAMGLLRVRHEWAISLSLFTFMPWRRKWQPTPLFLPGESQGRRGLVGCRLWGCTESDTTEAT